MSLPTSKKHTNFVELLEKFRPWMEAERLTMSEAEFCKKYQTSAYTVINLMWHCPDKYLWKKSYSIELPIDEINKLRLTLSDVDIAPQYNTCASNIWKRCWKRSDLWLPYIANRTHTLIKDKWTFKVTELIPNVMTTRHEKPKQDDYWKVWEIVEIWSRAIPFVYSKIK